MLDTLRRVGSADNRAHACSGNRSEQLVHVQDEEHPCKFGEGDELVRPVTVDNCDTGACELPSKFTSS